MNFPTAYVTASLTAPDVRPGASADFEGSGPMREEKDRCRAAESDLRLRDLGPAAALLFFGMTALLVAMLSPSGKDGQYAVIAPPWYRLGQTIALIQKADGGIVDMAGPANMVIAHSKSPDFVHALYASGAWLVIDPMRLRGCVGFRQKAR
jgi:hypothetical protein